MIIQSFSIAMGSSRSYRSKNSQVQSLNTWGNASSGSATLNVGSVSTALGQENAYMESGNSKQGFNNLLQNFHNGSVKNFPTTRTVKSAQERDIEKIKFQSINFLLQLLFGKSSKNHSGTGSSSNNSSVDSLLGSSGNNMADFQNFGGEFFSSSEYFEQETTCFSTTGTVVTAEGHKIQFGLNLEMSRSFYTHTSTYMQFGAQLCDPLVINLDSNMTQVSDQTFLFDLDADGQSEQISMLQGNSGFLALDKNKDGRINNGSELFGTQSGDGFYDLSEYDLDHNGWIDEADDVFNDLVIWTKNDQGKDTLCKLKDVGIGAIYLKNVSTEFSLNQKESNETNAVIRNTGIFLYEKGSAGTIQHVDLAKKG